MVLDIAAWLATGVVLGVHAPGRKNLAAMRGGFVRLAGAVPVPPRHVATARKFVRHVSIGASLPHALQTRCRAPNMNTVHIQRNKPARVRRACAADGGVHHE